MSSKNKGPDLNEYGVCLENRFQRWNYIYENGASDPGWPDGVNLNLVRNHIIYYKRAIEDLIKNEENTFSLFALSYPDIYYRETPPEVSQDYMAKAEEIRTRAEEQLTLYESNPDFCYIRDHHNEIFAHGETKATRAAGLYPGGTARFLYYRQTIEQGDLLQMRNRFSAPYEKNAEEWAALAEKVRQFLETDHSLADNTPVADEYYEADDECETCETGPEDLKEEHLTFSIEANDKTAISTKDKPSLDDLIYQAESRTHSNEKPAQSREEQLSFF